MPADLLDKYEAMAIFPEDRSIPCSTLRALWGISGFQAERFATELGRRSLLKYDNATRTVHLHDVFRAYLVRLHTNTSSLHSRLIDGWGDPRQLPDAYAWRHYAHHLAGAGRLEELKPLLLDYTWLRAKLNRSDAIALRDDAARFPDDRDFRLLARALEQSAHILAKDPAALREQLYGRLMGISSPVLEKFLKQIRVVADEGAWLRPLQPGLTPADSPLVRIFQIPKQGFSALALTWMAGGRFRGRPTVRCGCGICRVRPAASWAGTVAGSFGGVDVGWAVGGFGVVVRRCGATVGSAGSGQPRAGPARWRGLVGGVDVGWPVGGFGVVRRCGAAVGLREARARGRFPRRRSGDGIRPLV